MSMTIATQPSVPTAAGTIRGPAADPAAAGTFGAALTAAVATERQTGDGARQREDTDGTSPEASTAVPLGTRTGTGTAAGAPATTPDPSGAAGEAMPAGAQALLVAGLVTTPVAPTAPSTGDAADRPAAGTPDPSAEDPRAVVVSAVVADATPTPPAGEGRTGSSVVGAPASALVPAAAGATAASTAAAAAAGTATATVAADTAQQGSSVGATPAAVATTTSATTTTTPGSPAAPAPAAAPAATATDTAGTAPAPAASPTSTAPAAPTTVPTRADDGVTVVPTPVVVAAAAAPAAGTAPRTGHATEQQVSTPGDPGLLAVVPTRGGETPAVVSTTPTTASVAPTPSAPLAQQLTRPVFSLAQAGPGEHVVTVQVVPDTLGPVTVRAHVTAHGMHVELFAASDAGREAVRQVLPDLRRDAASAGGSTTLDLSSQNQPRDPSGRDERPAARALPGDTGLEARVAPRAQPTTSTPSIRTAGLDVLA
ncbi:flagellar hook-length control protein FliK [Curtobacterium oceanosedimentum]|uniref:flagellar hook-length control protein FliK n=1 Tax=Curtobacterium oceanosedimentum TaxID=465820 RepID=UPI001CE0C989|nr:flagellar hook-length control protein FliK [Curtobacterium oceanosedimentum]MCA5923515.1 flagellar hook-length control protein FliK [Curtobacterium oceanosedimentum]